MTRSYDLSDDKPAPKKTERPKCPLCNGAGWRFYEDRPDGPRRCECNPGEMPRSWNGGEFGAPQYPKRHLESVRDPSEPTSVRSVKG